MKKLVFFIILKIYGSHFSTTIEQTYSKLITSHASLQSLLEKLKLAEQYNDRDKISRFTQAIQENLIKNHSQQKDRFIYFFDYLYKEKAINDLSDQIKLHEELLYKDKEELELFQKYKSDLITQSQELESQGFHCMFQQKFYTKETKRYANHSTKLLKEHLKPETVGTWQALLESKKAFFCHGCKQPIKKETGFHACQTKTCLPEIFSCIECYNTHLSPRSAFTCPTCDEKAVDHHLYPIAQKHVAIASTQTD